ncbi:3-dehydroquinate synthase [soil metagenome]
MDRCIVETLELELGERSYPIFIGSGLLADDDLIPAQLAGRRTLVVTDESVGRLYLPRLGRTLGRLRAGELVLHGGEAGKTISAVVEVIDALVAHRCHRDAAVIALGGGVVGDIAGFAAACYQRGIAWLQVPTTLLAQVDSSVGGKTAVNHAAVKNLIGAFHQPVAVVADIDTLATLADRELRAGLAEVIKYGIACDAGFFDWLENHLPHLLERDSQALAHAIRRSCEIKADLVARDEREHGSRALLNLGHTFGHAVEAVAGFGGWLHGEAVAIGTCMAAEFSRRMGLLDDASTARIESLLRRAGLPATAHGLDAAALEAAMALDKKQLGGRMRLVMIDAIGSCRVTDEFSDSLLRTVLRDATSGRVAAGRAG